jgi:hypothetical protein
MSPFDEQHQNPVPLSNALLAYIPDPVPTLETFLFPANTCSNHFLDLELEGFYNYSFLIISFFSRYLKPIPFNTK